MRLSRGVGIGTIVVGLPLLGFGVASVDFIHEEGAGTVLLLVGAGFTLLGLLGTDWTRAVDPEPAPQPEDEPPPLPDPDPAPAGNQQSGGAAASAPPVENQPLAAAEPVIGGGEAHDAVPPDLVDPRTPAEVRIRTQARIPETDPTLGVELPQRRDPWSPPQHRLVVLGDSLSQGCQSLGMFNTDLSFPAIIASELGCFDSFRRPTYSAFEGLPVNLEYLVREMELRHAGNATWWELGSAVFHLDGLLDRMRDLCFDPAVTASRSGGIMHNLAIPGCDIRDLMTLTADTLEARRTNDEDINVRGLGNAGGVLAYRVLASARVRGTARGLTPVEAAKELGNQGGIETLIVFIGAANAMSTVLHLDVNWSRSDYGGPDRRRKYSIWCPTHFQAELDELAEHIFSVTAAHVIWATVPHVTIMPISRGVGANKMRRGSRYFANYTRPWISDEVFNPDVHPHLTGNGARAVDAAIDQYNDAIADKVREARQNGRDWLLMDVAGMFDQLAARRYVLDPDARPPWWTAYPLPSEIIDLKPEPPDSRFFAAGAEGRVAGGLFSLDGVHPTAIMYAMLAQQFIRVMERAGVEFYGARGQRREPPIEVDYSRVIARDMLISDPPRSITADLRALAWADDRLSWVSQLARPLS